MFFKNNFSEKLSKNFIERIVSNALAEDLGQGDLTTASFIAPESTAKGKIIAKENGVIAGLEIVKTVFQSLDNNIKIKCLVKDGTAVKKGQKIITLQGRTWAILSGERTALNFLQHLSGVATSTNIFTKALKKTKVKLLDTRKTMPGLRLLEKYAVTKGGGFNHRLTLAEMILTKDNHLALSTNSLERKIKLIRTQYPYIKIEAEAHSLDLAKYLAGLDVDIIMIDNMKLKSLQQAVKIIRKVNKKILIEASGGITLKTIKAVARTGVDFISVGCITHSAPALDLSLQLNNQQ